MLAAAGKLRRATKEPAMTKSASDFIHFEGITFNRPNIIAVSGPSYEIGPDGKALNKVPFFTVHLIHGVTWRFEAPTEQALFDKRAALIQLLG